MVLFAVCSHIRDEVLHADSWCAAYRYMQNTAFSESFCGRYKAMMIDKSCQWFRQDLSSSALTIYSYIQLIS